VADFAADDTVVCPGAPVYFSDLSSLPSGATISSYVWTFSGGFASSTTVANPIVYYYTPGIYSVSLTITVPGYGTFSKTKTSYIEVVVPAEASFTYSYPDICDQLTVSFSNTSVAGDATITSYLWDFNDGTFSTSANPTHTFTSDGTFDVILFITDGNGCSDNYTGTVIVTPSLSSSMSSSGSVFSCGTTISPTITATTSGGMPGYTYSWDYGNGTTGTASSATVSYTDCGAYDITYTVTDANGCTVTNSYNDYVNISCPTADFLMSDDTICQSETVAFTNLSSAGSSSYLWQFSYPASSPSSTAENPTYTYTSTGTKFIKLTTTWPGGCTASHYDTITIIPKPTIGGITATDTFGCDVPFTTTLSTYGITGAGPFTYEWIIDGVSYFDESPTITLYETINYDVTLIVTDMAGCSSTLTASGFIKIKKPVIEISATPISGCAPLEVTFTNASSSAYVPLDYFVWNYDDGNIDTFYTTGDHTYTFTETGNYHVEMTLYTIDGCPKTTSVNIEVGVPVAYFELEPLMDTICNPVYLDNQSTGTDYTTVDWGDGFISVLDPPMDDTSHFYLLDDTATYTITLTAEDNGCYSTWVDSITVLPAVNAVSTSWDCTLPTSMTIEIDTSLVFGSYCLAFESGDTICDVNPLTYDFGAPGVHSIELIPLGGLSEEDCPISTTYYAIIPGVTPSFTTTPTALCDTGSVTFTSTSVAENTIIVSYTWDIGPGLSTGVSDTYTSSATDYTYDFTVEDVYPITFTVTDINSCTYTLYDTIVIGGPTAYFVVDSIVGCSPKKLFLSDSSSTAMSDTYITEWVWDYDGLYPDYVGEFPPPKNFPNGIWDVTLTVQDNMGCTDAYVQTFDFSNVLTASFLSDSLACDPGEHLNFINTTSGDYTSITWYYGDGTIDSISIDGDHLYASEGFYTVTLTVSDTLGCISTYADSFYVQFDSLVAGFDLDYLVVASCPPIPVQLINTSTGDIIDFYWEVERETGTYTYTLDTLLFTYTLPGSYNVDLIVSTTNGCVDTVSGVNAIDIPGPVGTMTFSPVSGCLPLEVTFDIEGLDADLAYIDFGDGDTTLITGDYTYTYSAEGTFTPSLILIDSTGCFYSVISSTTLHTYGSPVADFSISDSSICLGDTITITDLSTTVGTSPAISYSLDFGDGTVYTYTSGFDSVMYVYDTIGAFTITLIESNPDCSDTISSTVLVNTYPTAVFDYSPVEGCYDLSVDFTISGITASDVLIDFGDSVSAYITGDTTYVYTLPGYYIPSLTLNSASGCTQPIAGSDTIKVFDHPVADFIVSDTSICEGGEITIYNTDTTVFALPVSYSIDFGDGTIITLSSFDSVTHTYTSSGSMLITVVAENGYCADSLSIPVNVNAYPVATMLYAPAAGCYPLTVDFTFTGLTADTVTLYYGDGNSDLISGDVSYTYFTTGAYLPSLTLTNTTACNLTVTSTDSVFVYDLPVASIILSDSTICEGSEVTIYNTASLPVFSPALTYTIDFGDGTIDTTSIFDSITHIYTTAGVHLVTAIADNGFCTDSVSADLNVYDIPSATMSYTPLEGCYDLAVAFAFTGLVADTILLDFGDGTSAPITDDITYTYAAAGSYVPSIQLSNISGCNQSVTGIDTIQIYDTPIAGVTLSDSLVCEGGTISVYNASDETLFSPAYTYTLNYGDGSSDVTLTFFDSTEHIYTASGVYTLSLVADNGFCADTAYANIYVNDAPDATISYTPLDGCFDHTVLFSFTGLLADTVTLYYGDGNSDIITGDVNYTYSLPGAYLPYVTLENASGCNQTGTGADTIHVYSTPVASFTVSDSIFCEGTTITILNASSGGAYTPALNYELDFGDGTTTSLLSFDSITHTYLSPSVYTIQLIAGNGYCSDTTFIDVIVNDIPDATMVYDPLLGCENLTVDFTFTGLTADAITLYFGDGNSAPITTDVSYTYPNPGKYIPYLELNNATGCNQMLSGADTIIIHYEPLADMLLSDSLLCFGSPLTISNASWDTTFSPILNYTIDYGDGSPLYSSDTFADINHTYTSTGTYTVSMYVTNAGCGDSVEKEIVIAPIPSAVLDIFPITGCGSVVTDFVLSSVSADSIYINTGDTTLYVSATTSYLYDTPGIYYPGVTVIDATGCSATFNASDSIIVSYEPLAEMMLTDSMPYCSGDEILIVNLSDNSVSDPVINAIDFVNVFVNSAGIFSGSWFDSIPFVLDTPGDYHFMMIVGNEWGCADTIAEYVTVYETPLAVAGADEVLCPGLSVTLDGTLSSGGMYYSWSPATLVDDPNSATPTGIFDATTTMSLTYSNDYCSATDDVVINVLDDLLLTAWPDTSICVGESVQLYSDYDASGGDVQILWLQGDYLNSTLISNPVSTPLNSITYTVQAACGDLLDYSDVTIIVNPLPEVDIVDTATMILEEPIQLDAMASGSGVLSYNWTPADYLNCTTCPSVVTNAPSDIVYFVNVTDENGCSATDSIYLRVVWNCAGEGIEVANIITPNNDGINDKFQFRTEAVKELFYFNIYNRWGELMHSSSDPANTWDGTFNGKACDPGVYIYTIKGICFDDEEFIKSGNITLVK
jgi:gliding motility-associated-like protein